MEQENNNREESIKESYTPGKLSALRRILEARARCGNPYYFKIQVSGIVIVERTTDLERFDSYEELLPAASEITIWIYTNEKTPNYYMKKVYTVENKTEQRPAAEQPPQAVGLGALDFRRETELMMKAERLQIRLDQKDEKIKDLQEKLSEAEEHIDKQDERIELLKKEVDSLKEKRRLEDRDLGALLSGGAEGLIRRNPHWVAKFGGENLAGIIEMDNREKENFSSVPEEESEASFSKKGTGDGSLSNKDRQYIECLKFLKENFPKEVFRTVMEIVAYLSEHPDEINTVATLLDIEEEGAPEQQTKK